MKIIEALKKVKDLRRKADDLVIKVRDNCAISSLVEPKYGKYGQDQKAQVDEWVQAHKDILQEIARLKLCIQVTNLSTPVTIVLNDVPVTKTIAYWIQRRQELAALERTMWANMSDRGIKEGEFVQRGSQDEAVKVKVVRFYDPATKDSMMDSLASEPITIDSALEITNAITDLIETINK